MHVRIVYQVAVHIKDWKTILQDTRLFLQTKDEQELIVQVRAEHKCMPGYCAVQNAFLRHTRT